MYLTIEDDEDDARMASIGRAVVEYLMDDPVATREATPGDVVAAIVQLVVALMAERDEARDLLRRARHACLVEMEPWDEDDETITGANAAAARILGVLGDTP